MTPGSAALAAEAPPLTSAQRASLATLLATTSTYPETTPNAANAAASTAAARPSRSQKDEVRHVVAT